MSPNRVQKAQARTPGMDVYTPPSNQHDSSSTPALPTTQSPWESTASASNMSVGTFNAPSATSPSGCKKRPRGRRVVTALACTECREKRAKCDGQQPCRRCSTHEVGCHYKAPMRQSKSNLRSTIDQLRRQQASNEMVINALSHSRKWNEVLCQLRSGRSVEAISGWLVRQLPPGPGGLPPLSHLSCSGADTSLANLALFADVGDALYASQISDESVSTSTGSSISSEPLLGSRYGLDTNSQWGQYLDASQAYSKRSPSQPATESSRLFNPSVSADDLAAFWAKSMLFQVDPSPASSSAVAISGDSVESPLFWPLSMHRRTFLPTGDAFAGPGFGII